MVSQYQYQYRTPHHHYDYQHKRSLSNTDPLYDDDDKKKHYKTNHYRRRSLRPLAVTAILVLFVVTLTLTILSSSSSRVSKFTHFRSSSAHQPPIQPNSTSGDAKWYSDWSWLRQPFSLSVTHDETRSVLPPQRARPPIYAFYDDDDHHHGHDDDDEDVGRGARTRTEKEREMKLLMIWRRAWWAQGFRPVVLGRAEAMLNPLYELVATKKAVEKSLETELLRWLAWEQMGTGILSNWLVLPMGPYDDPLLSRLRRGEFPQLTRYDGLGTALFSGEKTSIKNALTQTLKSPLLKTSKALLDVMEPTALHVESTSADVLAFYGPQTLSEHYQKILDILADNKPAGLNALARLITSHLQLTFLNTFSTGISILNPYDESTALLAQTATHVATSLARCPSSPLPDSCPPNHPKCTPCASHHPPFPITAQSHFINTSSLYTIGTIPHPYTLAALIARKKDLSVRHIRRDTDRDPWLFAATQLTLGKRLGGPSRIVSFKESVASEWGAAHSFWLTESSRLSQRDLEWHFGFEFAGPHHNSSSSSSSFSSSSSSSSSYSSSLAAPQSLRAASGGNLDPRVEKAARKQHDLIQAAQEVVNKGSRKGGPKGIRDVVEAWNLADTEAWRFVRAFGAREAVERKKWEAEERRFAGGKREADGLWARWFDS